MTPRRLTGAVPRARQVVGKRHRQRQPLALAVLAQVAEPRREPRPRRARLERHGLAVHRQPPADRPILEAHQPAQQLGAAGADEAGDAEHLAGPHAQARVLHPAARPTRPRRPGAPCPQGAAARVGNSSATSRPTMWLMICGSVERVGRARPHRAAVAQDREIVGDGPHLLEEVADVDHGDAVRSQAPDETEQALDVLARQAARGLVHQHHACVCADTARQISTTWRAAIGRSADAAIGMQLRMVERREHARGLGSRGGAVVAPAAAWLAAEQDVLGHREVVAERQFLVDQRDAGLARRERTGRRIRRRRRWPSCRRRAAARRPARASACSCRRRSPRPAHGRARDGPRA